jgi:hypothetical protein
LTEPNAYIPVTIAGIIGVLLLIGLRVYASKKVGNESRKGGNYRDEAELNYKLNVVRVSAVLFGWLELVAAVVLVAKNSNYGVGSAVVGLVAVGLVLHLSSNVTFLIGYCCIVHRHRIDNSHAK